MKKRNWAIVVAIAPLVLCCLPLASIIGDPKPAGACTGAGPSSGTVTIKKHAGAVGQWGSAQVDNAAIIVATGQNKGIPARGWVVAVATAMTESSLINSDDARDHDSVGLFQQRPSQGWGTVAQIMDPVYASTKFYDALLKISGWEKMPLTEAAQKVQRSAYPDAYAKYETDAERVVAAVTGAASITDLPGASLADCGTTPIVSDGGWTQPVHAKVGSGFRTRERPTHQGVDLILGKNNVITAASDGKVTWAGCDDSTGNCDVDGSPQTRGCGWFVEIIHANKIATRYCHMIRRPDVRDGQQVKAGEPIGLVGTSGHSSGPHLHYEVHTGVGCGNTRCTLTSWNATDPVAFHQQVGAPLDK